MQTKTYNEASYTEIFHFAKEKFQKSWNDCCDLFHSTEILPYESAPKDFYLEEIVEEVEEEGDVNKIAYAIIIAFMQENGVEELRVTG